MLSRRAVAGAGVALVLAAAGSALGQEEALRGTYDPSASGRVLAYGVYTSAGPVVVVRPPGEAPLRFPGARAPALDGSRLAYVDDRGIRVVAWRTGREIARIDGPYAKPALDWPLLAYVRIAPAGQRLDLRDLRTGRRRTVAGVGPRRDLGRPALGGGLIAWHTAAGRRSELRVTSTRRLGRGRVVATAVSGLQVNPSIAAGRILWVEHAGSDSFLRLRRLDGGRVRTLARVAGSKRILWTTALGARRAYATRWAAAQGRAEVISRRWR